MENYMYTVTYKTVRMFGHFVLFNVYDISGTSKKNMMAVANGHGGPAFNMALGAPIYSNSVWHNKKNSIITHSNSFVHGIVDYRQYCTFHQQVIDSIKLNYSGVSPHM